MDQKELPLGLGMALAQNEAAMQRFGALSNEERRAVIEKAHTVSSRQEMEALVSGLVEAPPYFF